MKVINIQSLTNAPAAVIGRKIAEALYAFHDGRTADCTDCLIEAESLSVTHGLVGDWIRFIDAYPDLSQLLILNRGWC